MGNYLNIGNDGFRMVRNGKYVDKTGLIAFVNSTLETPMKQLRKPIVKARHRYSIMMSRRYSTD
jgi:hypothetical protein